MKRIQQLTVLYEDGSGEIFTAPAGMTGPFTVDHTVYPPAKKGEKAVAISYATAILPIPTPPHIAKQMGVTPVDSAQD